jgi:hypothetical protein
MLSATICCSNHDKNGFDTNSCCATLLRHAEDRASNVRFSEIAGVIDLRPAG